MRNMNIANIADGALVEQVDIEITKVLENIMDPNTVLNVKRKIVIEMIFGADDSRDVSEVKFKTKSILAPQRTIATRIAFDKNKNGEIISEELSASGLRGQVYMNEEGDIIEPKTGANMNMDLNLNVANRVVSNIVKKIVNIK